MKYFQSFFCSLISAQYLDALTHFLEIDNLGVQSDVFSKYTTQLDAVVNVLEVLEGSLLDLPSPQLLELQHLLETASKVKQVCCFLSL